MFQYFYYTLFLLILHEDSVVHAFFARLASQIPTKKGKSRKSIDLCLGLCYTIQAKLKSTRS